MSDKIPTQDPRAAIPDVLHTTADGEQYLLRCPSLVVRAECSNQAERLRMPRILVDLAAHSVSSVSSVSDGHSVIRAGSPQQTTVEIPLAELPPQLAADVAAWMATIPAVPKYAQAIIQRIDPTAVKAEDPSND
jgi:hypothetical protein